MRRLANTKGFTMSCMAPYPYAGDRPGGYPSEGTDAEAAGGCAGSDNCNELQPGRGDHCDVYQQTGEAYGDPGQPDCQRGAGGGDLEYIDEVTLLRALEGRVEL